MLPGGEVRLQGQAVDKAAQSGAALRAPPAPLKTTGATERPPLIPHDHYRWSVRRGSVAFKRNLIFFSV